MSAAWQITQAKVEAIADGIEPDEINYPRPAKCGWTLGGVMVHGSSLEPAHYSGTERCASIWGCPRCAPVIRAERAQDISQAVETWQERGGSVLFVTLTMQHTSADALGTTLNAALKGWQDVLGGNPWKKQRARLGIVGYVRAVEVTWGHANGWHPHVHALLFLETAPTKGDLGAFESWLYEKWATSVTKRGGGMPNRLRGVDLRLADKDGKVLGQYLSKVQGEADTSDAKRYDVGAELARADWKTARGGDASARRYAPFEFLDAPRGVPASVLWLEYLAATKGRRAITWSRGLRDLLGMDEQKTEDEVIEDAHKSRERFSIRRQDYRRVYQDPGLSGRVLEAVEIDRFDAAQYLAQGRYDYLGESWVDVLTGEVIEPTRGDPPADEDGPASLTG